MICFPYAGAGASVFRTWANQLPTDIEVLAIQSPGRESRLQEPLFTQVQPLIEALTPALVPHLGGPFMFYGHSVGALLAFAMARSLQQQHRPLPLQLVVSGRLAPHLPAPNSGSYRLPDAALIHELRQYEGTPQAVLDNADLMALFLPILRADLEMNNTYTCTPAPPLPCPITVFGGKDDPLTSAAGLAAWQTHTTHPLNLHQFSGGHFFLKTQQTALLETLQELLKSLSHPI